MTVPVGDAVAEAFRLPGDIAGGLRNRAYETGLDPGEDITAASAETLAAWTVIALAPGLRGARALNDVATLRGERGRFGTFITNVFAEATGPDAVASFSLLALSDIISLRDESGASAVVVHITARDDDNPIVLAPLQMAFATRGASNRGLQVQAVLPGHALASLAVTRAGGDAALVKGAREAAEDYRDYRRAEGHRLSAEEGLRYV